MKLIHFKLIFFVVYLIQKITSNQIQFQLENSVFPNNEDNCSSFGLSVSISNKGDIIFVGAPSYNPVKETQGRTYIFERINNNYTQIDDLIASDGEANDSFGTSVSISNDSNILLIGAPFANVGSNKRQGKAYIFQRNGTIWNQSQVLNSSDGEEYDAFGTSVSISNDGNILFIGAPEAKVANNSFQGKAYIFQKNGTNWNQSQILLASDGEAGDNFGYSISISNDSNIILIGAPGPVYEPNYTGKAYIFERNETNWNQIQILNASDATNYSLFGWSVSISNDGNILLIGAPQATIGNNSFQGKVYIFERNGTIWNQSQILISSDGEGNDHFGTSVSISNDSNLILIGAPQATVGSNTYQGKAYIFQKNGNENEWNQIQILIASDGEHSDFFGSSVSISENYALIGSSGSSPKKGKGFLFVKTYLIPPSSSSSSLTTIIVCSTVIPVVVIVGVILAIFFIRKRRIRKQKEKQTNEGDEAMSPDLGKWLLKQDK